MVNRSKYVKHPVDNTFYWHPDPMKNYSVRLSEKEVEYIKKVCPGQSISYCLRSIINEHHSIYRSRFESADKT